MRTVPGQSDLRGSDRIITAPWQWFVTGRGQLALVSLALGLGCVVVAVPLLVYTTTLAAFGLPHVLLELDYLKRRFETRLDRQLVSSWVMLLLTVVVVRLLEVVGLPVPGGREIWELGLLVALAATVVPALAPAPRRVRVVAATVLSLLIVGWVVDPITALGLLAVIHNLTPVGFLAERLQGRDRRRSLRVCALICGVIPVLILSGCLSQAIIAPKLALAELTLWPVGTLAAHLRVFVPPAVVDTSWAQSYFAAAVYLQCVHYAAVVYVLPHLAPARRERPPGSSWRFSRTLLRRVVVGAGAGMLTGFVLSFAQARAVYGIFAAVHAWIEIPLLLVIPALCTFSQEDTA
jgi:hypothetical protein